MNVFPSGDFGERARLLTELTDVLKEHIGHYPEDRSNTEVIYWATYMQKMYALTP